MNKYLALPFQLAKRKFAFHQYFEDSKRWKFNPKLHIGCGPNILPQWCNVDVAIIKEGVHYVNALRPLPFDNSSFQLVFSEHFIEHLNFEEGNRFFSETSRILMPGGILRTATPNLDFLVSLFQNENARNNKYIDFIYDHWDKGKPKGPAGCLNRAFYGWGHRFLYNAHFLKEILMNHGFGHFKTYPPGISGTKELCGIEQHGRSVGEEINDLETLVLEGTRL